MILPYWYTREEFAELLTYEPTAQVHSETESDGRIYYSVKVGGWTSADLFTAQKDGAAKGDVKDPRMCDAHGGSSIH